MAWRNANTHFIVPSMRLNFYRAVCWDPIENYFVHRSCLFCFLYILFFSYKYIVWIWKSFSGLFLWRYNSGTRPPPATRQRIQWEPVTFAQENSIFLLKHPFLETIFSRRLIRKPCEASCVALIAENYRPPKTKWKRMTDLTVSVSSSNHSP